MKRFLASIPLALALSLLYTGIVYAQGETPPADAAQESSIAAKLAGLVAAAAVVERIIELIWDFYENNILAASKLVGNANSYLHWAQEQVNTARSALVTHANGRDASALETAFQNAEKRLSEYLKSPVYITMKKKVSMPVGMVLGVIVAFAANLQMFSLLDILGPESGLQGIDTFITGLIIGTGSAPVHSLIGILQNTKDTVDAARALYSGKAIAEVTDAIKRLETQQSTVRQVQAAATTTGEGQAESVVASEVTSLEREASREPLDMERTARRMLKLS